MDKMQSSGRRHNKKAAMFERLKKQLHDKVMFFSPNKSLMNEWWQLVRDDSSENYLKRSRLFWRN